MATSVLSSEVVPDIKIELWGKKSLAKPSNVYIAVVAFLFFLIFGGSALLTMTKLIPFSFGLEAMRLNDGSWSITRVTTADESNNIHVGDHVLQADGVQPSSLSQINLAQQLVIDHNPPLIISGDTFKTNPDYGANIQIIYVVVAVVLYVFGQLIFLQAQQRQPALLFMLTTLGLALALCCSIISYNGYGWILFLQISSAVLALNTLFHFFVIFPKVKRWPHPPFPLSLFSLRRLIVFSYISSGFNILYLLFTSVTALASLQLLIFTLSAIVVAFSKVRFEKSVQAQGELRLLAMSLFLAIGPLSFLNVLPDAFQGFLKGFGFYTLSIVMLMLLPLGMAFSIVQYQSLGITKLVRRNLVYTLLALMLFGVYVGLLFISYLVVGDRILQLQLWVVIIFSIIAVFSFNRLQIWLQRLVDQIIFKDFYNYQLALQAATNRLVPQVKLEDAVIVVLSEFTGVLNTEFGALVIYQQELEDPSHLYYRKILKHSQSSMSSIQSRLETFSGLRLPTQNSLYLLHQSPYQHALAAVEVNIDENTAAVLTLGNKRNGEDFSATDVTMVETLAGLLQVKLQNALLIDELERQVVNLAHYSDQLRISKDQLQLANEQVVKVSEEERTRLARELHDEPLQRLMLILRQFDKGNEEISPRELFCWQVAQEVSNTLRTICFQLRPPILDDLGLMAALESLVAKLRKEESNLTISLEIDFVLEDRRLSPEVEAVLYRVAQEALQNVIKHAQASYVAVELSEKDGLLTLGISDDGHGFPMPFDASLLLQEGHLGLVGSRERLHSIGGILEVHSRAGEGTTIKAQIEGAL
jgi:signal transduction histidine kinase